LFDLGCRVICGIDSTVDQVGIIYPIIEINARLLKSLISCRSMSITKNIHISKVVTFVSNVFERSEELEFNEMLTYLQHHTSTDPTKGFIIYTFAKIVMPEQGKVRYKAHSLFYGIQTIDIEQMINN